MIYYKGTTDTTNFTIKTTGFLFVTHYSTSYKHWYLLCGNDGTIRYLYNGNSTATSGQVQPLRLDLNYLTSISSYVKDNLTYSTAGTSYALSAYQGYLLNQNKQEIIAEPLTADINLVDGTAPTELISGHYYFTGTHHIKINGTTYAPFDNLIFYYYVNEESANEIYYDLIGVILSKSGARTIISAYYDGGLNNIEWNTSEKRLLTSGSIVTTMPAHPQDNNVPSTKLVKTELDTKQKNSNLVTSLSSSSTDTQYPSAKCVYDLVGNVESVLQTLNSGNGVA